LDSHSSKQWANFAQSELAGGGVQIDPPLLNKLVSNRRGGSPASEGKRGSPIAQPRNFSENLIRFVFKLPPLGQITLREFA
jgi:hypothetical protein